MENYKPASILSYLAIWLCEYVVLLLVSKCQVNFPATNPKQQLPNFFTLYLSLCNVSSSSVYGSVKILHSIHIVKGPCIMCQSTKTSSKAYLITCPHHLDLCVIYKEIKLYFHFMKQESFSLPACTSAEWM